MSGLVSSVANYGGRVPDNLTSVKQFVSSSSSSLADWVYKKISNITYITPANTNYNVLIQTDLVVNGNITNASDTRLKTNITDISNTQSQALYHLHPKEYIFNNDPGQTIHYGFLSQNVEQQLPSLVKSTIVDDNEYQSVNYIEIIPLLVHQIQQLNNKLDALMQTQSRKEQQIRQKHELV